MSEQMNQGRMKEFEMTWRNKFLTIGAESIDEMIGIFEDATARLKNMKEAGVYLDPDGGTADDYARLVTHDARVAETFGLEEPEWLDEEEDIDEYDCEEDCEEDDDEEEDEEKYD